MTKRKNKLKSKLYSLFEIQIWLQVLTSETIECSDPTYS